MFMQILEVILNTTSGFKMVYIKKTNGLFPLVFLLLLIHFYSSLISNSDLRLSYLFSSIILRHQFDPTPA